MLAVKSSTTPTILSIGWSVRRRRWRLTLQFARSRISAFFDGADFQTICARALKQGLELCPAEVGPALRLAYDGPGEGAHDSPLVIAMAGRGTLAAASDERFIFSLARDDQSKWLSCVDGSPQHYWEPQNWANVLCFVFVKPRK